MEQNLEKNMEHLDYNGMDSPEWLRNWWIQQEAERERLRNLNATHPGAPLPDPPVRPPKRLELRGDAQNKNEVWHENIPYAINL